jgi:hypothetical protein
MAPLSSKNLHFLLNLSQGFLQLNNIKNKAFPSKIHRIIVLQLKTPRKILSKLMSLVLVKIALQMTQIQLAPKLNAIFKTASPKMIALYPHAGRSNSSQPGKGRKKL